MSQQNIDTIRQDVETLISVGLRLGQALRVDLLPLPSYHAANVQKACAGINAMLNSIAGVSRVLDDPRDERLT